MRRRELHVPLLIVVHVQQDAARDLLRARVDDVFGAPATGPGDRVSGRKGRERERGAYQKLLGLYLFATIWMVKRLEEPGVEKTETTPSW